MCTSRSADRADGPALHDLALGPVLHVGQGGHETRSAQGVDGSLLMVKTLAARPPAEARERLEHEAHLLRRLSGVRGVVQIVNFDRERSVLITKRAEGQNLYNLLDNGELRRSDAWRVWRLLTAVLQRIHTRGVVHRDVSPGNIIFDRQSSRLALCDFGQGCDLHAPTAFERAWRDVEVGTPAFRAAKLGRNPASRSTWLDHVSALKVGTWLGAGALARNGQWIPSVSAERAPHPE